MDEGVNYLATDGLFENLTQVVRWAQDHDEQMQHMAKRNMELARNLFSWHGLAYYTGQLVVEWAERMEFQPRLGPGAFEFLQAHPYDTCAYQSHHFKRVS